jgi:hypothetical protein
MATRRFGPTRGAGVAILEKEGGKQLTPGALGITGYATVLEKGDVGELIVALDDSTFFKKCGGVIPDSLGPDAALDFYDLANGAGGLLLVRVTDGNEQQSALTLYQRNAAILSPMGTVQAKNGGRWGGKAKNATYDLDALGDLNETTLQLPAAVATDFATDEWKGGFIELNDVANTRYPITGNTAGGLITVATDQTMLADHSGGGDLRFYLVLESEGKALSVIIGDGEENGDTEFSLEVFVDGDQVNKYGSLHTDPLNNRYWVNIINNDTGNDEIVVTDLITGAHTAAQRPANHYGIIDTVTETVLTAEISDFSINSPGGGDPTFALGTTDDEMLRQKITITMTSATEGDVVSDRFGVLGTITLGILFDPDSGGGGALVNKWVPPFTVTVGGSPLTIADTLVINYKPFVVDALIGGVVYPDKPNAKRTFFRIIDNDHKSITVPSGSDLTAVAITTDEFLVEAARELADGRNGIADLTDADFEAAWDTGSSLFNRTEGKNFGLVKFGTPGITSTAVQKAGKAYADAKNHQYRYEAPANVVTEAAVLDLVNDTLGRSEYAVISFPSFGSVTDPDPAAAREGRLKEISLMGAIHGREARIAQDFNGYHKAEAGIDATLDSVLSIPTGDAILNEEILNPAGVNVIKKVGGNFILWGDRTLHVDPAWRFKHQRELLSFYEHVLQESFDFIVFAINDPETERQALAALQGFFLPEFVKRALRGDTFQDAAIIKLDKEINTDATRATGDLFAQISLRLADTVERFNIQIGKQGIFDSVG